MSSTPFFSIIVPVYNRSDLLEVTIKSVLSQSINNYELIIVNDGSTDDLSKIIGQYSWVTWISQKNAGQWVARNNWILHAHWEYVCFLDSDDSWEEHYLENLYSKILQSNDRRYWVYFSSAWYHNMKTWENWVFYDRVKYSEWVITSNLLSNNFLVLSWMCIKRTLLTGDNLFSEDQTYRWTVEDYRLWIYLSLITCFKHVEHNKEKKDFVVYNIHTWNDSGDFFRSFRGLSKLKKELLFSKRMTLNNKAIIMCSFIKLWLDFLYKKYFIWR